MSCFRFENLGCHYYSLIPSSIWWNHQWEEGLGHCISNKIFCLPGWQSTPGSGSKWHTQKILNESKCRLLSSHSSITQIKKQSWFTKQQPNKFQLRYNKRVTVKLDQKKTLPHRLFTLTLVNSIRPIQKLWLTKPHQTQNNQPISPVQWLKQDFQNR